ncbi:cysteine--tRNA ligase [Patescibacteria group bacterium]|nr:cysteine--tRNA ligase [Patescibacteria group bacterium]
MDLKLTNTLTRKKETFEPIHKGKVGVYSCGPTVYLTQHIGNFRSFIFADILRRVLEFNGYEVKQVMNITDVGHLVSEADVGEDKMIIAMRREGKSVWEIAAFYTVQFLKDMDRLNIKRPHVVPKATEHIDEMIEVVKTLEEKGYTYKTSDGIYFDTSKLESYGELSGQKLEDKEAGARVEVSPEKRNPSDFALWKFSPKEQKREMEWDSPWGAGFPGWHIECSAMSEKYLDSPFDIHTGGVDHIPVHHENEIAQTKGARGHQLANWWLHGEFLLVDGGKMSKSLGNFYSIDDLIEKDFDPIAFRYLVLGAHYHTQLNFTWKALEAAQHALNKLDDAVREWDEPSEPDQDALDRFLDKINDDLNMPGALAELWKVVNDEEMDSGMKAATLLKFDQVLGFRLDDYIAKPLKVPQEVQKLLKDRQEARKQKNWERSDQLRDQIAQKGFIVEDTPEGQHLREKRS